MSDTHDTQQNPPLIIIEDTKPPSGLNIQSLTRFERRPIGEVNTDNGIYQIWETITVDSGESWQAALNRQPEKWTRKGNRYE